MPIRAQLFDGTFLEFPDGTSPDVINSTAKRMTDEVRSAKQPEETPEKRGVLESVIPAIKRGFGQFGEIGAGYSLAGSKLVGDEASVAKKMAEAKADIQAQKDRSLSVADIQRIYKEKGLVNAAGEVPQFLVEQTLQSLPTMATPLAAGAATTALTAPILGPFAPVAGTLAGIGAYGLQTFGSGVQRQAVEKQKPEEIELGKAAVASAIGAPLGYFMDRVTALGGAKGVKEVAKELAARKTAGEIGAAGVAAGVAKQTVKGTGVGFIAEAPTETLEAVLDRWQAGLSLTGEEAKQEYLEAGIAGGGVGGTIGGASRGARTYGGYRGEGKPQQSEFDRRRAEIEGKAPAITPFDEASPLENPYGNIPAADIGDVAAQINGARSKRKQSPLQSFSVEDIVESGLPPEQTDQLLSAALTKSGFDPAQAVEPQDIMDAAAERGLDPEQPGFRDFLRRASGAENPEQMTPVQRVAAFGAIQSLPEGVDSLPTGTNAQRFTEPQYKAGLKAIKGAISGGASRDNVIAAIQNTGVKDIRDAQSILQNAIKGGELGAVSTPTFTVMDDFGKPVRSYDSKEQAEQLAGRLNGQVQESSVTKFVSPELAGGDVRPGSYRDEPAGFEIRVGDTVLRKTDTAEDAEVAAERLQQIRGRLASTFNNQVEGINQKIATSNQPLEVMEAQGQAETPQYAKLKKQTDKAVQELTKKRDGLVKQAAEFSRPLHVGVAAPKAVGNKGFTRFEGGRPVEYLSSLGALPKPTTGPATDRDVANIDALRKKLLPALKRFGLEGVGLRVVKSIEDGGAGADGAYADKLIQVALSAENPMGVMRHEVIHALKELGAFTAKEWRVLEGKAKSEWVNKFIREAGTYERYQQVYENATGSLEGFDEYINEEAIAEAFKYFDATKVPPGLVGNLFGRIRNLFASLRNALQGAGFQTAEEVLGRIEEGKVTPAQAETSAAPRYSVKSIKKRETDITRGADEIAAMDADIRENTSPADMPGGYYAYEYYEARKLQPKPSAKLKRVTDNNSMALWSSHEYVANVDGELFGVTKQEDPDDPDNEEAFVYSFERLAEPFKDRQNIETVLSTPEELFDEIRGLMEEGNTPFLTGEAWKREMEKSLGITPSKTKKNLKFSIARPTDEQFFEGERKQPKSRQVVFEIAPNPDDKDLSALWGSLSHNQKIEISNKVKDKFTKSVMDAIGARGRVTSQVGSYLDETNASYAMYLEKGNAINAANALGFVFKQQSMLVVSPTKLSGLDNFGSVVVDIGDKSFYEIEDIYNTLRSININGKQPVSGQTTSNGKMIILNKPDWSGVETDELAEYVDAAFGYDYNVLTQDVFASFPEAKDYDYASPENDPAGSRGDIRRRLRGIRDEASKALGEEIAAARKQAAARGETTPLEGPRVTTDTIEVDGQDRPTRTSKGTLIYPTEEGVRNFWRWFGNSVFVDEDGRPLVMYHGTAADIEEFIPKQANAIFITPQVEFSAEFKGGVLTGVATWSENWMVEHYDEILSPDQIEAAKLEALENIDPETKRDYKLSKKAHHSAFVETAEFMQAIQDQLPSRANVIPLFVKSENPFNYSNENHVRQAVDRLFLDFGVDLEQDPNGRIRFMNEADSMADREYSENEVYNMLKKGYWPLIEQAEVQDVIRDLGFDGFSVQESLVKNYAVFDPNQVKSSVGNDGNFSDKKGIRFSIAQSKTPEFKQWFRESKVSDKSGKPVLMYHSTPSAEDDIFSVFKRSDDGKLGQGIYTTSMERYAEGFAPTGVVMPLWVSIQNPLYLDLSSPIEKGRSPRDVLRAKMAGKEDSGKVDYLRLDGSGAKEISDRLSAEIKAISGRRLMDMSGATIRRTLQKAGYDGIIVRDADGNFVEVNAFEPTQIKSATGNRGTFSPKSKDIRYSIKGKSFYHVTQTKNADKIRKKGLLPLQKSNWVKSGDKSRYGGGNVFVFENPEDAVRWAAKMDWEFNGKWGSGNISIVEVKPSAKSNWVEDTADPLTQAAYKGKWLKKMEAVPSEDIGRTVEFTKDMLTEGWSGFGNAEPDQTRYSLAQTKTPEFKRWFGNSKMVDKNGEPLVAYHGSTAKGVTVFDTTRITNRSAKGDLAGTYFTDNPVDAGKYTRPFGRTKISDPRGEVVAAYLKIENPLNTTKLIKKYQKQGMTFGDAKRKALESLTPEHDGIIFDGDRFNHPEYVVFSPTQIKSATGNIGTFDPANPDIRYSFRDDIKSKLGQGALSAIDRTTSARQGNAAQKFASAISPDSFTKMRQRSVNKYESIERNSKTIADRFGESRLYADYSAIGAALFSDRAAGIAAESFKNGVPVYANGFTKVDDLGGKVKGLLPILKPLMKYNDPFVFQAFQFYGATRRGARLMVEGREKLLTPQDIRFGKQLEQTYPEFKTVFDEYQKYNRGVVKFLVDTGVLSEEMGKKWMMYADYIPFYRQADGEETFGPKIFHNLSGVQPTKRLKGGEFKLDDFIETVVRNTRSAVEQGMKNVAAQRAVRDAVDLNSPGKNDYAKRMPPGTAGAPDIVTVREKGKDVQYWLADPLLYEALKGLNLKNPYEDILRIVGFPTRLLRELVTKMPDFMLTNLFRDSAGAWTTSGTKFTPIIDTFVEAGKTLVGMSPEAKALKAAGIGTGYEFSGDIKAGAKQFAKELRKVSGKRTAAETALLPITKVWDMLDAGSNASDLATRAVIYKRTMEETGNEAEAALRALEVMNFGRMGSSQIYQVFSAIVPFFGARVQGLDLLYRAGTGRLAQANRDAAHKAFKIRALTLFALSIAYWMLASDTDEYKKANEETRDNYWIIGSVRVPIPFEIGVLFKVIPERMMGYLFGTDTGKDVKKSAVRNIISTLSMNPVPQGILPILEANVTDSGYSSFTGRGIIPRGMEDVAPQFQETSTTSTLAKKLGKELGVSPIKIDHVIQGYFGSFGTYMAMGIDSMLRTVSDPVKPAMGIEQTPIIKRFYASPLAGGTKEAFFDLKDRIDEVVRTQKFLMESGRYEDLTAYMKENGKLIDAKSWVSNTEKELKSVREIIRATSNLTERDITPEEKREALNSLRRSENYLTEQSRILKKSLMQ